MSINTVLIANRGEIARRVIRACRELGIRSVAIHTDLDRAAAHVREADDAVRVASYLDIDAVVAAAGEADADAVHPGYGFLSERPELARAVEQARVRVPAGDAGVLDPLPGREPDRSADQADAQDRDAHRSPARWPSGARAPRPQGGRGPARSSPSPCKRR